MASDFETCLNKDGNPIDLRLNLDIIYPATRKDASVVMISSSAEEKMSVTTTNKERPLDLGFVMNGCAVAVYEHVYTPMARTDHYGYFGGAFSMNGFLGSEAQSAAVRCVRYFADTYGYSKDNYAAMGHSKGSLSEYLSNPHPEKIENPNNFSSYGYYGDDHYGEQPFLCDAEGNYLASNVDVVYSSMGPGINNYHDRVLTEGSSPMILACGLWDDVVSDSWSWWTAKGLLTDHEEAGIPYVAMTELDIAHDYPYLVDPYYNYDRYVAFVDMMMYYITDGYENRLLYSSIVDSRVVDRIFDADGDGVADATIDMPAPVMSTPIGGTALDDSILDVVTGAIDCKVMGTVTVTNRSIKDSAGSATLTRGTDLYVQFLAPVTEDSVEAHMYLLDSEGNRVDGKLVGTSGGTKWEFVPAAALTNGTSYTLVVEAGIVDIKYGNAITDSAQYRFTWGE